MNCDHDDIKIVGQTAHFAGRIFPCTLGRNGVRQDKREGDGTTPAGRFELLDILYRPDRLDPAQFARLRPARSRAAPCPHRLNSVQHPSFRPLRRRDIWSDDPTDPDYNRFIAMGHPHHKSHERLWRQDHQYDLIIPVAYNWHAPVAGVGSAIFIHVWRAPRRPTEGCVAFAFSDLLWIIARVSARTCLIVSPPSGMS